MATATATRPATTPSRAKSPEKPFEKLVSELAAADLAARKSAADSTQARAERSNAAVSAIRAAYAEKLDPEDVRKALLDGGVLKGTVSKIVTVLKAVQDKHVSIGSITSLNGGYTAVKLYHAATAAAAAGSTATATPYSTPTPAVVATTPEDALKVIVNSILSITDPDERLKVAGIWLTRCTNEISAAADADDEE